MNINNAPTDTDLTALIIFLVSRLFRTLFNCVIFKFEANLISLIHIPLLPASSMILYTTLSSVSAPFTAVFVVGSLNLYSKVSLDLNNTKDLQKDVLN